MTVMGAMMSHDRCLHGWSFLRQRGGTVGAWMDTVDRAGYRQQDAYARRADGISRIL